MKDFLAKYAHWIVFGVAAVWTVLETLPPAAKSGEIDLHEFGKLPVQSDGRVKPLDSFARTTLLLISNQQEFVDAGGKKRPAIRWLMDVLADPDGATAYKVIRIENDQVLQLLDLPKRPGFYRYSYAEVNQARPKLVRAYRQAEAKEEKDPKSLDIFEAKVLEVGRRLERYDALLKRHTPAVIPPVTDGGKWMPTIEADNLVLEHFVMPLQGRAEDAARQHLAEQWKKAGRDPAQLDADQKEAFEKRVRSEAFEVLRELFVQQRAANMPAADAFADIVAAYRDGKAQKFDEAVAQFREKAFKYVTARQIERSGFEAFLNRFTPFYFCAVMYICAFVLAALSWLYWPETLRKAAFWLTVLTLAVHTFALFGRMYVMERPLVFVTNLYSSAVFIAWGCVGIGLILEVIYRNSVGVTVGAILGAASNLIAHNLLADGDTLAVLQAVLDTNFWLASHVTIVTLGYVATLVAGTIGAGYVITGFFTPNLTKERAKSLTSMLYGVICFATFLSFTGTVLGGIWADQSWGRFWGWDPKENGAVLVVIWNALILHARWGGLIKARGMAVLSLVGVMITFWSWFGTNQLGVGLHAYGFSNKLAVACLVTWAKMTVLIAIGTLPLRYWRSFRTAASTNPPGSKPFRAAKAGHR